MNYCNFVGSKRLDALFMEEKTKMKLSPGLRIILLFIFAFVGVLATFAVVPFLDRLPMHDATLGVMVLQDVMMFIVPAIVVSMLLFKRPLHHMNLDKAPSWRGLLMVLLVCVVSMPALNWTIAWNGSLHLPQFLDWLEEMLRDSEQAAQMLTDKLLSETSLPSMLVVLAVVSLLAGLSEEMFFRGGMLRMLGNDGNSHAAVWLVGIVFSAMHVQFFGFVPRMLLGVWLGYLLVWTRSLWVPVIAHALNNGIVVVSAYLVNINVVPKDALENIGVPQEGQFPWLALASAVATVALVCFAKKWLHRKTTK